MKTLPIVILLTSLLTIGSISLLVYPYYIYQKALYHGLKIGPYSFKQVNSNFLKGGRPYKIKKNFSYAPSSWKEYHFQNFLMDLPFNNNQFQLVPKVEIEKKQIELILTIQDSQGKFLASIKELPKRKYTRRFRRNFIFRLPYGKKVLKGKNYDQFWKHLFTRKLNFPGPKKDGILPFLKEIKNYRYQDMIYNLSILYTRGHLFSSKNLSSWGIIGNGIGLLKIHSEKKTNEVIRLLIRVKKHVYTLELVLAKDRVESQKLKEKLLKTLKLKKRVPQLADHYYQMFKGLDYGQKIGPNGIRQLFMAWGQRPNQKEFLAEIIQYLERGNLHQKLGHPFYLVGMKRYGQTFSKFERVHKTYGETRRWLDKKVREEVSISVPEVPRPKRKKTKDEVIDSMLENVKKEKKGEEDVLSSE